MHTFAFLHVGAVGGLSATQAVPHLTCNVTQRVPDARGYLTRGGWRRGGGGRGKAVS